MRARPAAHSCPSEKLVRQQLAAGPAPSARLDEPEPPRRRNRFDRVERRRAAEPRPPELAGPSPDSVTSWQSSYARASTTRQRWRRACTDMPDRRICIAQPVGSGINGTRTRLRHHGRTGLRDPVRALGKRCAAGPVTESRVVTLPVRAGKAQGGIDMTPRIDEVAPILPHQQRSRPRVTLDRFSHR